MSTDLFIAVGSPVDVSALLEEMQKTFEELLGLYPIPLFIQSVDEGVVSPSLPPFLDDDSAALQVFFHSNQHLETGVWVMASMLADMHSGDDHAEILTVSVGMTGGAGKTWFRYVTMLGCAIAVARHSHSVIQCVGNWEGEMEPTSETLMKALKCRQPHTDLESACREVIRNYRRET